MTPKHMHQVVLTLSHDLWVKMLIEFGLHNIKDQVSDIVFLRNNMSEQVLWKQEPGVLGTMCEARLSVDYAPHVITKWTYFRTRGEYKRQASQGNNHIVVLVLVEVEEKKKKKKLKNYFGKFLYFRPIY